MRAFHHGKVTIVVNKASNTMKVFVGGQRLRRFRVTTGFGRSTPEGRFKVIEKSVVSRNGNNQFGTRWMALNVRGHHGRRIGIHGTNEPRTIGRPLSKGCVRMLNAGVNRVYALVPLGTTVLLVNIRATPVTSSTRPVALRTAANATHSN